MNFSDWLNKKKDSWNNFNKEKLIILQVKNYGILVLDNQIKIIKINKYKK
jgi:hypothetical protein